MNCPLTRYVQDSQNVSATETEGYVAQLERPSFLEQWQVLLGLTKKWRLGIRSMRRSQFLRVSADRHSCEIETEGELLEFLTSVENSARKAEDKAKSSKKNKIDFKKIGAEMSRGSKLCTCSQSVCHGGTSGSLSGCNSYPRCRRDLMKAALLVGYVARNLFCFWRQSIREGRGKRRVKDWLSKTQGTVVNVQCPQVSW